MPKRMYTILFILFIPSCIVLDCTAFSLHKKIKSLWQKRLAEKIDQREIPAQTIRSLSLVNNNGSVTIKTGPKKSLFLRAIQRAKKNQLDNLAVAVENTHNHVTITSQDTNKKKNSYIDYELIVPASCDIALRISGDGDVMIKDVQGSLDIAACNDVTVINTKKMVSVQTRKRGTIALVNAHGPVKAHTYKGAIIGEQIAGNFHAHTTTGNIKVFCKNISPTSTIDLTTTSGTITLALPAGVNARMRGNTIYGTFMCDHEVTLKPYTTKLNKMAWTQFRKFVDGVIGTGDASIAIESTTGNVKIIRSPVT